MTTVTAPSSTSQISQLDATKTPSENITVNHPSCESNQRTNDQYTCNRVPIELSAQSKVKLDIAKQKLQRTDEPWLLRITSYLRISCAVIQTAMPVEALEHNHSPHASKISYSRLMHALFNYHPEWWKQCSVDETGKLVSDNPSINVLLSPLSNL